MAMLPEQTDTEQGLAKAVDAALRWGTPPDPVQLRNDRSRLLGELVGYNAIDSDRADKMVGRLYTAFTRREVAALANPRSRSQEA